MDIHDVCAGGPGPDEIAKCFEEMVRVMAGQCVSRTHPFLARPCDGAPIGNCARRIRRTVGAIGAQAQDDYVLHPGNSARGRERELLIATTQAIAPAQSDGSLAAGDDAGWWLHRPPAGADLTRNGGMNARNIPGLAVH